MELNNILFVGIVEDNIDPRRLGRIKVRIPNIFDNIPTSHIPWSSPYILPTGDVFAIPSIGKSVNIVFDNNCIYNPYYVFTDKFNINLQDKIDSLSDSDYIDFGSLIFNHNTQFYNNSKELVIDHLINKIKMDNDNVNIELKDNKRKINLGTENADQRAVLGDHFVMEWFKEFLNILAQPTSLTGNSGNPILKAQLDQHILKFLKTPEVFVSKNVYIVDNDKVNKLERDTITNEVKHDDTTIVSPLQSNGDLNGYNVDSSLEINENVRKNIQNVQEMDKKQLSDVAPDGTTIESKDYMTSKKSRSIKGKKSKYNHENRDRVDRYNSSEVKKRKGSNNETTANSNYGMYKKK